MNDKVERNEKEKRARNRRKGRDVLVTFDRETGREEEREHG